MFGREVACEAGNSGPGWFEQTLMNHTCERGPEALQATAGVKKVCCLINPVLPCLKSDDHVTRHGEKPVRAQELSSANAMKSGHQKEQDVVRGDVGIEMGGRLLLCGLHCFGELRLEVFPAFDD